MEGLLILVVLIGLLLTLDVAALKWGKDTRLSSWLEGGYDPYYDWHSRDTNSQAASKQADETGEITILWQKTTPCLN